MARGAVMKDNLNQNLNWYYSFDLNRYYSLDLNRYYSLDLNRYRLQLASRLPKIIIQRSVSVSRLHEVGHRNMFHKLCPDSQPVT